jgi:hypothetical protein
MQGPSVTRYVVPIGKERRRAAIGSPDRSTTTPFDAADQRRHFCEQRTTTGRDRALSIDPAALDYEAGAPGVGSATRCSSSSASSVTGSSRATSAYELTSRPERARAGAGPAARVRDPRPRRAALTRTRAQPTAAHVGSAERGSPWSSSSRSLQPRRRAPGRPSGRRNGDDRGWPSHVRNGDDSGVRNGDDRTAALRTGFRTDRARTPRVEGSSVRIPDRSCSDPEGRGLLGPDSGPIVRGPRGSRALRSGFRTDRARTPRGEAPESGPIVRGRCGSRPLRSASRRNTCEPRCSSFRSSTPTSARRALVTGRELPRRSRELGPVEPEEEAEAISGSRWTVSSSS